MKVIPIAPYVFGSEEQQEIAALAFEFWLSRSFRGGSPVDDLFRAARAVRAGTAEPAEYPAQPFLVRKPVDYPRATETEALALPRGEAGKRRAWDKRARSVWPVTSVRTNG